MQSVHDSGRSFSSEATGTAGPIVVDHLSRTWAALLFEVFSQRYERGSILVTTNLPFDEWAEIFGSERLTGALLGPAHPPRPHPGDTLAMGLKCPIHITFGSMAALFSSRARQ